MLQKIKAYYEANRETLMTLFSSKIKASLAGLLATTVLLGTLVYAIHTIRVSDGKDTYVVTTVTESVQSATELIAKSEDYEITKLVKGLYRTDVTISYNFNVFVTVGNETVSGQASSGYVKDILTKLNIPFDEFDIINPSLDTYIIDETYIDIVDIEYRTEAFDEQIPYGEETVYSDQYYTTTQKVIEGSYGINRATYTVTYVNGVPQNKVYLGSTLVTLPTPKTTIIGTTTPDDAAKYSTISTLKVPDDLVLDVNGIPVNYSKCETLRATAYTHTGSRCATLVWPQPGYVAVDPKKIPYGTRMYIVSADGKYVYGYAIAADTGGFIYGGRTDMDLFLDTEEQCVNFGRRKIKVYFLD